MPTEAKNEKKRVEDDQDRGVVRHSGEVEFDWWWSKSCCQQFYSGKVLNSESSSKSQSRYGGNRYSFEKEQQLIAVHTV